jgi:transketolase
VICCSPRLLFGSSIENGAKGGYVAVDVENTALILISSGSEVGFCVDAAAKAALTDAGTPTRIVSMPCQEIVLAQSEEYQKSVLPGAWKRLPSTDGIDSPMPKSEWLPLVPPAGSGDALFKHFCFTPANIQAKRQALVDFYKANAPVPNLTNHPVFDNIEGKLH